MRVPGRRSIPEYAPKSLKLTDQPLTEDFDFHTNYSGQSFQLFIIHCAVHYYVYDKLYDFEVAYGLVIFLNKICLHVFIGGYPFFYF